MATENETTLQVKDFRGVNRFADGTVTPPNEFYTAQGFHPVSRGELLTVKGGAKLYDEDGTTVLSLPGVGSWEHVAFLEQTFGTKRAVAFFKPSVDEIPAPVLTVAGNFTDLGGANAKAGYHVYVTYVGLGGAISRWANDEAFEPFFSVKDNGFRFTVPTGANAPPAYVAEIQIHVATRADLTTSPIELPSANFLGALQRRGGVFAASINLMAPRTLVTTIGNADTSGINASPEQTIATSVDTWKFTPISATAAGPAGKLEGGRTYFVGIMPFLFDDGASETDHDADVFTRINYADDSASNTYFSFTLPVGYTGVRLHFKGMPSTINSTTNNYFLIFIGETLEDLMAAEVVTINIDTGAPLTTPSGKILPIHKDYLALSFGEYGSCGIFDMPVNSSLQAVTSRWATQTLGGGDLVNFTSGDNAGAPVNRKYGILRQSVITYTDQDVGLAPFNPAFNTALKTSVYGAWVLPEISDNADGKLVVDSTACWQLLSPIVALTPATFSDRKNDYSVLYQNANSNALDRLYTRSFTNRLFITNSVNTPMYTNGISFKPIIRPYYADLSPGKTIPIAAFLEIVRQRLILGGGTNNANNTAAGFYYSAEVDPFNFGTTSTQFISTSNGDLSDIVGFGTYSPDLASVGPSTFLVVGKKSAVGVWAGTTDVGFQLLDKVSGFAGPRSFSRTNLGSVFVGRDNIYLMQSGQQAVPFGYEFADVIRGLNEKQFFNVTCVFNENRMRIAYQSEDTNNLDREIFLELRQERGGVQKFYSGPHLLQEFSGEDSVNYSGFVQDAASVPISPSSGLVLSCLGAELWVRNCNYGDQPADDMLADTIARSIVINRLGLEQDHLWKVIRRIYLALKLAQDETFNFTLAFEDGSSSSFTQSKAADFDAATRQLLQTQLTGRPRGRVISLTIANVGNQPISIFDISLLFTTLKRRQLS